MCQNLAVAFHWTVFRSCAHCNEDRAVHSFENVNQKTQKYKSNLKKKLESTEHVASAVTLALGTIWALLAIAVQQVTRAEQLDGRGWQQVGNIKLFPKHLFPSGPLVFPRSLAAGGRACILTEHLLGAGRGGSTARTSSRRMEQSLAFSPQNDGWWVCVQGSDIEFTWSSSPRWNGPLRKDHPYA